MYVKVQLGHGLYISDLKHSKKLKIGRCVPIEGTNTIYKMLSRLSDFVTF